MGVGAGLYRCDVVKKVHVRYLISWWVLVACCLQCCWLDVTIGVQSVRDFSYRPFCTVCLPKWTWKCTMCRRLSSRLVHSSWRLMQSRGQFAQGRCLRKTSRSLKLQLLFLQQVAGCFSWIFLKMCLLFYSILSAVHVLVHLLLHVCVNLLVHLVLCLLFSFIHPVIYSFVCPYIRRAFTHY